MISLPILSLGSFGNRPLSLINKGVFRSLGLFGFLGIVAVVGFGLASLAELIPEEAVVRTGFYKVPDGQYATLKPKSFLAFLPGDRVCVAQQSPDGKFNFHTIRRDDLK